jgi:hypothetical protein
MKSSEKILQTELDSTRVSTAAGNWLRLPDEIKRTEDMVIRFAQKWEPELSNTLQTAADGLAQIAGKQLFEQDNSGAGLKFNQTDAPVVVVSSTLNDWIDAQIKAEDKAREIIRDKTRDFFDIATSPEPAKEAKAKMAEAAKKEAAREPRVPLRKPIEELPKTNKDAMDELKKLRDSLAPSPSDIATVPKFEELYDLQLTIESMIWAATYDFTPSQSRVSPLEVPRRGTRFPRPGAFRMTQAPLPDKLWPRLVQRYRDPDEQKSYKDVGRSLRLGTKAFPGFSDEVTKYFIDELQTINEGGWWPEVRLSFYFGRILFPELNRENSAIVQKLKALQVH